MPVEISGRAAADLERLLRHSIAEFGQDHAERYYQSILDAFAWLAEYPLAARERPEYRGDVRLHTEGVHSIVYRPKGPNSVLIVRVLHGRQDIKRHL
ncbi:MAG: type II toxin-antitoxin system RelE/ParE family toxin [Hyphomicrobiales bacterium]|nr:MAG: type II toxin-antitoxin system RelE/ParE family toxin [Hyphomicrobiales bacterium]